jgi:hypothetical protein
VLWRRGCCLTPDTYCEVVYLGNQSGQAPPWRLHFGDCGGRPMWLWITIGAILFAFCGWYVWMTK